MWLCVSSTVCLTYDCLSYFSTCRDKCIMPKQLLFGICAWQCQKQTSKICSFYFLKYYPIPFLFRDQKQFLLWVFGRYSVSSVFFAVLKKNGKRFLQVFHYHWTNIQFLHKRFHNCYMNILNEWKNPNIQLINDISLNIIFFYTNLYHPSS